MTTFAGGRWALAICDRCGMRGKYTEMVCEPDTGLRVHPRCMDERNPYLTMYQISEPIVLRDARPDTQTGMLPYLIDELGNYMVDANGNFFLLENP